jgi:hypothetical protein
MRLTNNMLPLKLVSIQPLMHLTLFTSLLAIIVLNSENQMFFNPTKEGRLKVLQPEKTPYDQE